MTGVQTCALPIYQKGEVVISGLLEESQVVDLSEIQNGIYHLQLRGAGQLGSFKVIKK